MLEKIKKEFESKGEIYLKIKVRPNSANSNLREAMPDGLIKVDIAAPPVKGKANQELIILFSKIFDCSKEKIKIIAGVAGRTKLIKIIK